MKNLVKRVMRFALRWLRNYRIRALIYVSKPNWDLLSTIAPRSNPMRPFQNSNVAARRSSDWMATRRALRVRTLLPHSRSR